MRFCTWSVRSLYRAVSPTAAGRELARYELDLLGVQEVRSEKGGTLRTGDYSFFYGKGNENLQLGTGLFYTTDQYQQLRVYSLLATGCDI